MAAPNTPTLTFLRGSGFLLSLIGVWDLQADASGRWPGQKGVLIFQEAKITAVIERHAQMRRGIEGTYAVEGNRLRITGLSIDTAPVQGPLGEAEFTLDGDLLTMTWLATPPPHQVDTFRRRVQGQDIVALPPVAIYTSGASPAPSQ